MKFNDKIEPDKKAEIAKKRDDKAERLRKCQQCLVDKLSALNSDQGEYEELMIRLALDEQDEKEKQKEKVILRKFSESQIDKSDLEIDLEIAL